MAEVKAEVVERNLENLPSIELNKDRIDAMIQFSKNTVELGKALDRLREFALKRAWVGDFVQHGDKVNVTGPGAERILSAYAQMGVPIEFLNWTCHKDTGSDKYGEWYTWWYDADVTIGGFRSRIEGRASSRDKFFGFEDKAWKDIADVKEADVRMAARRCVFKEAAKAALGIRSIPPEQAEALGLNPDKIKRVEYGKRGETKVDAAPAGTPVTIKAVNPFKGKNKKTGKEYVRYDIVDDKDAKYSTFDDKVAEYARTMIGKSVVINYTVGQYGNDISEITPATDEAAA